MSRPCHPMPGSAESPKDKFNRPSAPSVRVPLAQKNGRFLRIGHRFNAIESQTELLITQNSPTGFPSAFEASQLYRVWSMFSEINRPEPSPSRN